MLNLKFAWISDPAANSSQTAVPYKTMFLVCLVRLIILEESPNPGVNKTPILTLAGFYRFVRSFSIESRKEMASMDSQYLRLI